jgi:hypothetical protein
LRDDLRRGSVREETRLPIGSQLHRLWQSIKGLADGSRRAPATSSPQLRRFRVLAAVVLRPPEPIVGPAGEPAGEATGYFRNIGVTAESEHAAQALVEQSISDGSVTWPESRVMELSDSGVRELMGRARPLDGGAFRAETSGIWYQSGRSLY